MNQGKYVFSQVVEFIPRYQFDKLMRQYKGDWHVKNLSKNDFYRLYLKGGQKTEVAHYERFMRHFVFDCNRC